MNNTIAGLLGRRARDIAQALWPNEPDVQLKPTDLILRRAHALHAPVSKDGRWHDLACGRPSRRARKRALLRTRLRDARASARSSGRGFETRAQARAPQDGVD